jgi:NhaA family Na+:H+ antiporter
VAAAAPAAPARRTPLTEFLHDEAAGGVVLLVAAVVAMVWANSPVRDAYVSLWSTHLDVLGIDEDLQHWVNDGLMALFFFVVGLEIKRELVEGELRDRRAAALPALAATAGAVAPAALFALLVGGGEAGSGWAIPMATDIAFAIGILALLGDRVSAGVKLLVLAIAVVDDIIAIGVIAAFYSEDIHFGWLAAALAAIAVVVVLRRAGVTRVAAYVPVGLFLWVATLESGIHATVAGVVLGLLTPAGLVGGRPVLQQLEHRLHPLTSFVVVPLFALANAGVYLGGGALSTAASSRITWAIVAGLVLGKLIGVGGAIRVGLRTGTGVLPAGVTGREVWGAAALAGIGFTVALFIAALAYDAPALESQAKVGIFAASMISGALGAVLLATQRTRERTP